jgi:hypothetical protein
MLKFLKMAADVALSNDDNDKRNFWLGAVAIRRDGVIVQSRNGAVIANSMKKAGYGPILYVARVRRKDRALAMARPCDDCMRLLKFYGVVKCYYTISPYEYGIINVADLPAERTKSFEPQLIVA